MSLPRRITLLLPSLGGHFVIPLLLVLGLTCETCFASQGDFSECAQKALQTLPSPPPKLLEPLDTEAWLNERSQLSASSLRTHSMKQSHLWLETAMQRLVHSAASGPEKIEAFSRFVSELGETTSALQAAARARARKWRSIELHRWNCRRFDVGGGVTAFVGDSGRVLEFRPNGDIYRATVRTLGVEGPMSPKWRPPYTEDGSPLLNPDEPHLSERWVLERR